MRQLLFTFLFLLSFSFISCNDNSTGPDQEEETPTYSVNVEIAPSDAGIISPSEDDTYEEGEEIELEAEPDEGYLFSGWSGDTDSTSDNPLSLTVDQDYSLKADFEKRIMN